MTLYLAYILYDYISGELEVFGRELKQVWCYELKSLELDKSTNSCIRVNTRELDRDLFTNWSTLYTTTDGLC